MSMRDLMPWNRGTGTNLSTYRDFDQSPFMSLHREMSRMFDDMWRDFNAPMLSGSRSTLMGQGWPNVEISENGNEIRVSAEMPGMEEKDIDLSLSDGVLTIRGEKQAETEDKDRQFSERYYGRFERRIPVGSEVEEDKVAANFKNGVLTITLPKTARAQAGAKRIAINGSSAGTTKH